MSLKVGILEESFTASSWYRTYGPLNRLRKVTKEVEVISLSTKQIDYKDLLGIDVCLVPRPNSIGQLQLLKLCKQIGIKTWVDLDDNLYEVPLTNFAHKSYKNTDILTQSIQIADLVTVSTGHLALAVLDKTGIYAHVINNAIILPDNIPVNDDEIKIIWRGSNTHYADLEIYKDVFSKLKYPLHIMGCPLYWNNINYTYYEPQSIFEFFNAFKQIQPTILLYPLQEIPFNYSKSNIAFLEGVAAGAITFTNLSTPEWNWECIGNLKRIEDSILNKSKDKLLEYYRKALDSSKTVVEKNYDLDSWNEMRLYLLNDLL